MARVKGSKVAKCSVCGKQVAGLPGEVRKCKCGAEVTVPASPPVVEAPVV
jgi:hypothetical protein